MCRLFLLSSTSRWRASACRSAAVLLGLATAVYPQSGSVTSPPTGGVASPAGPWLVCGYAVAWRDGRYRRRRPRVRAAAGPAISRRGAAAGGGGGSAPLFGCPGFGGCVHPPHRRPPLRVRFSMASSGVRRTDPASHTHPQDTCPRALYLCKNMKHGRADTRR